MKKIGREGFPECRLRVEVPTFVIAATVQDGPEVPCVQWFGDTKRGVSDRQFYFPLPISVQQYEAFDMATARVVFLGHPRNWPIHQAAPSLTDILLQGNRDSVIWMRSVGESVVLGMKVRLASGRGIIDPRFYCDMKVLDAYRRTA